MVLIERTTGGGMIGEYTLIDCYVIGYSALQLYPKQQKQDTGSETHNFQDGISQKSSNDRGAKKDGSA